ncbi:hypothetical protein KUCAC02_034652 [Chaenocephalus aceratus]|nr:hypothetical protein KUCAC02_034652 [Chaenocephalus aceratus]
MAYYDDETTRKKKAAALLLLMHLREHDEQLLQGRGKARSVWVRRWLSEKRRERYGHYSTLLNELKTEDEKAFFNYTRLPRGLYDEVLRRVEGRMVHMVQKVSPSWSQAVHHSTTPGQR